MDSRGCNLGNWAMISFDSHSLFSTTFHLDLRWGWLQWNMHAIGEHASVVSSLLDKSLIAFFFFFLSDYISSSF